MAAMPAAAEGGLTFVFSDIEGSTRLVEELANEYGLALRICRRMVVNAFAQHGGQEFGNEGDGQFFVFSTPATAAAAAVAGQRKIDASEWPDGVRLRVRMGIHCGPVHLSGGEYVGMTIHEVARVSAAANGGQVLCTAAIADAVRDVAGFELRDLGRFTLRGFGEARTLYQLLADGLDPSAPSPRNAVREGGNRVVIWRRSPGDGPPSSSPAAPVEPTIDWTSHVPGVDVVVHCHPADSIGDVVHLTVLRDGVVEEEYDGLTIGGAADVAAVVNANSRLIAVTAARIPLAPAGDSPQAVPVSTPRPRATGGGAER